MKANNLKGKSVRELIALVEDPDHSQADIFPQIEAELKSRSLHWHEITEYAKVFWKDYFQANMRDILKEQRELQSQFVHEDDLRDLFQIAFTEYRLRIKDMGIDDHRKFWVP